LLEQVVPSELSIFSILLRSWSWSSVVLVIRPHRVEEIELVDLESSEDHLFLDLNWIVEDYYTKRLDGGTYEATSSSSELRAILSAFVLKV
jgi:hypothetical protein